MKQFATKNLHTLLLLLIAGLLGAILMRMSTNSPQVPNQSNIAPIQQAATEPAPATETIPPYTPLATLTPSRTLKPPPTFEPPTATLAPSATPTITPTQPFDLSVSIPGLRGAETATPSTTPGCTPREDWKLVYEVQNADALAKIAERYGTSVDALAAGNCLTDPDLIRIGQRLRVPGDAPPVQPQYDCAWEVLTPRNGTQAIEGSGILTFNWRGPQTPYNLIRIIEPDDSVFEVVVELRQNEQIDLEDIPLDGWHTFYIYPLDQNFQQVACPEGGPWRFRKNPRPTDTPTPESGFGP
jgi:LysM repeat protein